MCRTFRTVYLMPLVAQRGCHTPTARRNTLTPVVALLPSLSCSHRVERSVRVSDGDELISVAIHGALHFTRCSGEMEPSDAWAYPGDWVVILFWAVRFTVAPPL